MRHRTEPDSIQLVLRGAIATIGIAVAATVPLHAEGPAIAARGGTLGIGPEMSFRLDESVHLRASIAALDYDDSYDETGIDYDADLELRNAAVLLDFHPGGRSFRLTAGAVWNDTELVATAPLEEFLRREVPGLPPTLPFDVGILRGTATVDPVGPYLGFGFGNPFQGGRWGVSLDIGAVYHGEPEVELVAETSIPIALIPGGQERLDQELAEEEAELQEEVDGYTFLPVVSLSISYAF